jgi:hypothetical protein
MAGAGGFYRAAVELPQGEAHVIVRSRNGQGSEASSTIGGAQ